MAEALQREYSLAVVKVHLADTATTPWVLVDLVLNVEGHQRVVATRDLPLAAFGLDSPSQGEPELSVPPELPEWIAEWANGQLKPQHALWLHLRKPYGLLGAVPWEQAIQPAIDRPLLRLPDRLPEPVQSQSSFHLALVATGPAPEGVSTATQMGPTIARALADGIGPGLRLHVFADAEAHAMMAADLAGLPVGDMVIYPPDLAPPGGSSVVANQWLRWVHRSMRGRALDAVHFVTHGCALGDEGGVLTTHSPASVDRRYPEVVQVGQLQAFLVQVGALVAGFSRPFDNYSDYGLRRLVDDIGATRAGPVLLHEGRSESDMGSLAAAYRFLTSPVPAIPPADPSLMLFAQPRQVAAVDVSHEPAPSRFEQHKWSAAVQESFAADDTPSWISAATRYVQDGEAELLRYEAIKQSRTPTRSEEAYYAGMEAALQKIRTVIDAHAERGR